MPQKLEGCPRSLAFGDRGFHIPSPNSCLLTSTYGEDRHAVPLFSAFKQVRDFRIERSIGKYFERNTIPVFGLA